MINNRQNGRRRGRGNNGATNGAPRQGGQGGQGRPDNGNRIDSRARGNANQLFEKYKNLAGEAQRQGDRVNTEYYLQFADHYFRVLADQRGRTEDHQPRRQQPFDLNDDEDYGDEGEVVRAGEQDGDGRDDMRQPRAHQDGEPRQYRGNGDDRGNREERAERAPRDAGGNRDNGGNRDGVSRDEQRPARDEQRPPREERAARRPRAETGEPPIEVAGQRRADPLAEGETLHDRAEAVLEADAPLARPRRGRPRRDAQVSVETVPEANTDTAAEPESNSVEADRLPPSLNIAAANDAGDEAPKPRRRRVARAPAEAPVSE